MSSFVYRASALTAADFGFVTDPAPVPAPLPPPQTFTAPGPFEAWTDGSCQPNPGRGGWCAILRAADSQTVELSGCDMQTTNNRMELCATIAALEALPVGSRVVLFTDSEYVRNGITRWVGGWVRKGWRTAKGASVANRELWEMLVAAAAKREVDWRWVKGHAGDVMNVRADALANAARGSLNLAVEAGA